MSPDPGMYFVHGSCFRSEISIPKTMQMQTVIDFTATSSIIIYYYIHRMIPSTMLHSISFISSVMLSIEITVYIPVLLFSSVPNLLKARLGTVFRALHVICMSWTCTCAGCMCMRMCSLSVLLSSFDFSTHRHLRFHPRQASPSRRTADTPPSACQGRPPSCTP